MPLELREHLDQGRLSSVRDWLGKQPDADVLAVFAQLTQAHRQAYLFALANLVGCNPVHYADLVRALMSAVNPELLTERRVLGELAALSGQSEIWLSTCLQRGFPFAVIDQMPIQEDASSWHWFEAAVCHPVFTLDTGDVFSSANRGILARTAERMLRSPFRPGFVPIDMVHNNPWFASQRDILWAAIFHHLDKAGSRGLEKQLHLLIPPASGYPLDPPIMRGEWLRTWLVRRYGGTGQQAEHIFRALWVDTARPGATHALLTVLLGKTAAQSVEQPCAA